MHSSAKSTRERKTTLRSVGKTLIAASLLAGISHTLPAVAREGDFASSLIPLSETIRRIREAADTSTTDTAEATPEADVVSGVDLVEPRILPTTFTATAYCLKGQTASGVSVRRGIIAADPKILPLGSVVRIHAGSYSGIYTVMDTGGAIRGQRIDIYLPTRTEAMKFGSRKVKIQILRFGWDPEIDTEREN